MDVGGDDSAGSSGPVNSKLAVNIANGYSSISSNSETSPLLSTDTRLPRLRMPTMSQFLRGEKRDSSSSPSRNPAAPPASPAVTDSASMIGYGTNRNSTVESSPIAGPSAAASVLPNGSHSRPKLQSLKRRAENASLNLTLENSGSVARDHLASERTFLAYVRTSLAIASTGVALVQLFTISASAAKSSSGAPVLTNSRIQKFARPLGATTVVMGLLVLVIGVVRYFTIQNALTKGKFPVARVTTAFIAVVLSMLVVIVFGVLIGARR